MKHIYTFLCLFLSSLCSSTVWSAVGDKYSCELIQRPWIEHDRVSNKTLKDWPNKVSLTVDWKEGDVAILRRTVQERYDDGALGNPTDDWELPEGGLILETKGIWQPHQYGEDEYAYGFEGKWENKLTGHLIRFFPWWGQGAQKETSVEPKKLLWIQYGESPLLYNIHVFDFNCQRDSN